jgi:Cu/Ag efflux pump CusA
VFDGLATPSQLGAVPVENTSPRLRLTDVAEVVEDHPPLIGDAVVGDGEGLLLVVEKLPGTNALEVTQDVEDALETLEPGLSGMEWDTALFRPATMIEAAIDNVALALAVAGSLLVLVLAAFLFAWWSALVAIVAIPLSLLAAALVLDLLGHTMNAIAFAGLAGALVVVVDDAVAGVEAVARRVRDRGRDSIAATILEASHDVRRPIGYATLVTLLSVVPVAVMEGRPGAFFEPLALAYALAVLTSMAVALTATPALCLLLLRVESREDRESPIVRWTDTRYADAVARAVRAPRATLLVAGACAVGGLAALPLLSPSLLPSFRDTGVLVRLDGAPGTSQPEMTRVVTRAGRELRALPGVESVGAHLGRAVTGDQVVDVNSSELWVRVDGDADYDATLAGIDGLVGRLRGFDAEVLTYARQRMGEVGALARGENDAAGGVDVLTGAGEPLVVRLYGADQDVLRRQADRVRGVIAGVDGLEAPRVDVPATQPSLEIEVDVARARAHGIKPGDVRRAEATLLQGIQVGSIFERQKVFDVVVQGVPETRESVASVRGLLLDTPRGGHVRLGDVADVRLARAPTVIERDAVSRHIDLVAGVSGRSAEAVAADVEARLAAVTFPIEYHAEVLTESTGEEAGATRMIGLAVAAAIAALLLLQAAFGSWRLGLVAFLSLPLALLGGVLAALAAGGEVSLGALVGFLALLALAARAAVALLAQLQRLQREEGEPPGPALVVRGARERAAPVLATAAAVAVVMAPLAILGARPGLEIVGPMAVVVLGGLLTTTLVALFVLPAVYLHAAPRPESSLVVDDVLGLPGAAPVPARERGRGVERAGGERFRWAWTRFGGGLVATRRKPPAHAEDDDAVPPDPEERA